MGLRAPGMFIALLKRTGASYGRHPGGSLHTHHQTLAVLSWLRSVCAQTIVAALASVPLWGWPHPARPLLGVSGRLFGPSRSFSLVCPTAVRRQLGRSGTPAKRRGHGPACAHAYEQLLQRAKEGQTLPRSLSIPQCQSATAQKSKSSHTRAHTPFCQGVWETWKQDKEPPRL